eukprot:TRINITY_DN4143_c0_g1_i3.p1 TRINITY_DN4143_c0_g1~~TRINITY_DN4143_c0_g1_i3.p1  ORF type:complete len:395 (+),score=64.22 TRINITY_DN4143_c0_g1_i3:204-1388(+)
MEQVHGVQSTALLTDMLRNLADGSDALKLEQVRSGDAKATSLHVRSSASRSSSAMSSVGAAEPATPASDQALARELRQKEMQVSGLQAEVKQLQRQLRASEDITKSRMREFFQSGYLMASAREHMLSELNGCIPAGAPRRTELSAMELDRVIDRIFISQSTSAPLNLRQMATESDTIQETASAEQVRQELAASGVSDETVDQIRSKLAEVCGGSKSPGKWSSELGTMHKEFAGVVRAGEHREMAMRGLEHELERLQEEAKLRERAVHSLERRHSEDTVVMMNRIAELQGQVKYLGNTAMATVGSRRAGREATPGHGDETASRVEMVSRQLDSVYVQTRELAQVRRTLTCQPHDNNQPGYPQQCVCHWPVYLGLQHGRGREAWLDRGSPSDATSS